MGVDKLLETPSSIVQHSSTESQTTLQNHGVE